MSDTTIPARSPWGTVQYGRVLADGIVRVGTAGHGGVRISPQRLTQMPPALRLGRQQWFEEDCEASLVDWAFHDDLGLSAEQTAYAERVVRDYFPEQWEAYTGRTLAPGESCCRDAEVFATTNADKFVSKGAFGAWHDDVPKGYVGVTAIRTCDGARRTFLVEADRYHQATINGHVIDEAIDKPWETTVIP